MENQINVSDQNTQQIGQNSANKPISIQEKPRANYLVIGIVILVCFTVFGFGGYYLGKQSSQNITGERRNQISPTPVVTEKDLTANWKTYRSTLRGGFEFMYPNDAEIWFMKDMTATVRIKSPSKRLEFEKLYGGGSDGNVISIGMRQLEKTQTIEEYVSSEIEGLVTQPEFSLTKEKEAIVLNGLSGYTFISTSDKFGSSQRIYLINPFSKSVFARIMCNYPSPNQQGCIQLATQILSTFKFFQ